MRWATLAHPILQGYALDVAAGDDISLSLYDVEMHCNLKLLIWATGRRRTAERWRTVRRRAARMSPYCVQSSISRKWQRSSLEGGEPDFK